MAADPLRVMLVEDEAPARDTMRGLLARDPEVELVGETWGARSVEAIRTEAPELIFLDVRMPRMDGFEVLRRLDPDRLPVVVFVTAYEEHAVEAFEVRALDYVLKPFTDERFAEALARAKERVRGSGVESLRRELLALVRRPDARQAGAADFTRPDRVVLDDGGATVVLPPSRITWVEASGPYVIVHAEGREYLVRASLTAIDERLTGHGFFRVHRSAVVGLDHVREVRPISHGDALVVLRDGTKVKLSRARRERFEEVLRSGE